MAIKKDELVTGAELSRRLKVTPVYITNNKNKLKNAKCMFGKKYYFRKSSLLLGKDPDNPHESYQQTNNVKPKEPIKKPQQKKEVQPKKEVPQKNDNVPRGTIENIEELKLLREENAKLKKELNAIKSKATFDELKENIKRLYIEMSRAIGDSGSTLNKAHLDGLKGKAAALKELELAVYQGIKNKQLDENSYDRESVIKIINIATSSFRKSLLNLANNYATSLEGMTKLEIKEYVLADINKILEDFQAIGKQFE